MINVKYYEVYDAYDAEGRGPDTVIGKFTIEEDAYFHAKGNGNYGQNAHVREVTLLVAETLDEHVDAKIEKKKQNALAKLTKEEKGLLGLE